MVRINPDERFNAAQCLERGCRKHLSNEVVIVTSFERCNTSEEDTEEAVDISTHYASENGTIMPTQFPLRDGIEADNILRASTILDGAIWETIESCRQDSENRPTANNQLTLISKAPL